MSREIEFKFSEHGKSNAPILVLLIDEKSELSGKAAEIFKSEQVQKAAQIAKFTGKAKSHFELLAPIEVDAEAIHFIGLGDTSKFTENDWVNIGGSLFSKLGKHLDFIVWVDENLQSATKHNIATNLAMGAKLKAYKFDRYKTKKKDDEEQDKPLKLNFACSAPDQAEENWKLVSGVADGVILARDLVNEPANILGPEEFAQSAKDLEKLGCNVTILDEAELEKIGMRTLLCVGQGSRRPSKVAIIEWSGGQKGEAPLAFIGKGVVFDTGGISIKPGANMGEMKGDMGGAGAVTGLMHALAARKAKANVLGVIGLVENMPDGNAIRPGDIVTSLSGQTVEILNTDAEGRLVLSDLLWYVEDTYTPKFMINLATLTGAILVALGSEHAGLFSNDDELSEKLTNAGLATGEKLWRMPLGPKYDKLIDTPNADMKNIGGRYAGSITAGQFLQRFVRDVPWAHLDIAGTAMSAPKTDVNASWASGFGVRLLDQLVADNYES